MEQVSEELAGHPGAILRAAREEMGLTQDQAADALHLRTTIVVALENDAFDAFDSPLFLRGYFRSYCRLVNLHEERMVELLDQLLGKQGVLPGGSVQTDDEENEYLGGKKLIPIMCLVVGALVVAITLFGNGEEAAPGERSAVESEPVGLKDSLVDGSANQIEQTFNASAVANEAKETLSEVPLESSEAVDKSDDEVADASSVDAKPESPEASIAADTSGNDGSSNSEPTDDAVETTLNVSPTLDSVQLESSDSGVQLTESPSIAISKGLKLVFAGDCWVTISNEVGRKLVARLKRSGDEIVLTEQSEYNVVLGDASVVKVWFDGQSVDLTPYTSNNKRAAFKLPGAA